MDFVLDDLVLENPSPLTPRPFFTFFESVYELFEMTSNLRIFLHSHFFFPLIVRLLVW